MLYNQHYTILKWDHSFNLQTSTLWKCTVTWNRLKFKDGTENISLPQTPSPALGIPCNHVIKSHAILQSMSGWLIPAKLIEHMETHLITTAHKMAPVIPLAQIRLAPGAARRSSSTGRLTTGKTAGVRRAIATLNIVFRAPAHMPHVRPQQVAYFLKAWTHTHTRTSFFQFLLRWRVKNTQKITINLIFYKQ